jgi:hypothetical protein
MTAKIGYVDNTLATGPNTLAHHNMLDLIRRIMSGDGSHGAISQTGTGNGKLTNFRALSSAVAETWTITATSGGPTAAFSVVGSVSGAQAAATVGTAYSVPGKVAFKLIDGSVDFIVGDQFQVTVAANVDSVAAKQAFFGTGNGTMTGFFAYEGGQSEVWTVKLIAAAADGGTFSVTGSRSGPQGNATVGTPYDNGLIKFTINDGATDFVLDDIFTMIPGIWKVLRWDDGGGNPAAVRELIMQGSGHTGMEEIFIGFRSYHSVASDYYNLAVSGFIGYVPGNTFETQPGYVESGIPCHNLRIDYWLSANPARIAGGLKVGTPVYQSFYAGFFLPYATPSQYPYPLFVGGMFNSAMPAKRYSDTDYSFDGSWRTTVVYPLSANNGSSTNGYSIINDTNDVYSMEPLILEDSAPNIYGQLEGVFAITGFNNVVENTLTVDGVDYVVIQDVFRTGFNAYIALELR